MTDKNSKLTARQRRFVSEYVLCLNATQAAIRAGYAESSAHVRGCELVKNSKVQSELKRLFDKQGMQPEEIIARLADQARADIGDFIDPDTFTIDWKRALETGKTRQIKKVKQTIIIDNKADKQTEILEIELHDSQKALVHLGRTYALFADKLQIETWQSQVVDDIRRGIVTYEDLAKGFDNELATELFARAGMVVSIPENTG